MRKKIIYGCISVLGLVFLFFIGFRYGEYEEKKQIERVKMEEQQDAEAAKIAERYVEKYSDSLQKSMAIAPLTDLKVEYQKLTWSEYQYGESCSNKEETEPYDIADYHYYYELSYVCDSIDQIFAEMTQGGDYSEYIDLMNKVRMARSEVEDEYETWQTYEEKINGKLIQVDVKGEYSSSNVTLKKADGQEYCLAQNQNGRWIYINGERIYEEARSDSNRRMQNYYSRSTSSYYSSDPYDVSDYDDPDDFAEEWAEEFGDGDCDDGYDDAYDYWESERD